MHEQLVRFSDEAIRDPEAGPARTEDDQSRLALQLKSVVILAIGDTPMIVGFAYVRNGIDNAKRRLLLVMYKQTQVDFLLPDRY